MRSTVLPRAVCLFSGSCLPAVPSRTVSVSGRSTLRRRRQSHVSLRRSTTTSKKTWWLNGRLRTEPAGPSYPPFGHGTKHKLANELGYQSRDLCCDELRTRVALTLSWHEGGMEYSSGDNRRRVVRARDFVGSG